MSAAVVVAAVLALGADAGGAPEGAPPRAAPLSLQVRVERTEARLGEPIAYEIDVRHPPEESYALTGDLDVPPFRIAARGCRTARADGEARTTCALSLALFALGSHDVPAVSLSVRTPAGDATLAVPGPRITGIGIIDPAASSESLALRDLAPPVPLYVRSFRVLAWAGGALLAVAAALLLRRAWRKRAVAPPAPSAEPPGVRLARRLDALEAKQLPARGEAREHVFELSAIVREWVGAVSGLNALDLTTAELVERIRWAPVPGLDAETLRRFCEEADLVKYARAPADPGECARATAWARSLPVSIASAMAAPTPNPTSTTRGRRP